MDILDGDATDFVLMARLYCVGEKILDDGSCDAIMSATICDMDERNHAGRIAYPYHEAIDGIYQGTLPDSPMRRFVVDMYAQRMKPNWHPMGAAQKPNEFMQDLPDDICKIRPALGPHGSKFPRSGTWLKAEK